MNVWERPSEVTTYRDEERVFDDGDEPITFKVTRRSLSFPEEARMLAKVRDAKTGRPDVIEMLALTVESTVKDNDFGLTPDRVRNDLPDRPALAWFLIRWLCAQTLRNIRPDAVEELRKKSGP